MTAFIKNYYRQCGNHTNPHFNAASHFSAKVVCASVQRRSKWNFIKYTIHIFYMFKLWSACLNLFTIVICRHILSDKVGSGV